jgi:hypothetical protein
MKDSHFVDPARREIKINAKDLARFWAKVDKNGPTIPHMSGPCWTWLASKNADGYGKFRLSGQARIAHRVSFLIAGGVFTEAKPHCLHQCDNPACCNPAHLFTGSNQDNVADRESKGRNNPPRGDVHYSRTAPERLARGDSNGSRAKPERLARGDANGARTRPEKRPRGEKHGCAKLSDVDCEIIRSSPLSGVVLGRKFGISQQHISRIRTGKNRRITDPNNTTL